MDTVLLKTLTFTANWGTSIDGDELGDRIALDIPEGRANAAEVIFNTTTNITGGTKSNLEAFIVSDETAGIDSSDASLFGPNTPGGLAATQAFATGASDAPLVNYVTKMNDSAADTTSPFLGSYLTFTHDEDRDAGVATVTVKLRGTPRQYSWGPPQVA